MFSNIFVKKDFLIEFRKLLFAFFFFLVFVLLFLFLCYYNFVFRHDQRKNNLRKMFNIFFFIMLTLNIKEIYFHFTNQLIKAFLMMLP